MTIEIDFGPYASQTNETLTQRIQFVYSPLNELFRSLHVLLNPRHHGMNIDWALASRQKLSSQFFNDLHYFELIYELGVPPVFFNNFEQLADNLDDEIAHLRLFLRRTDPQIVRQSLEQVARDRENKFIPKLAKSLEWQDYQPTMAHSLLQDLQTDPDEVYGHLFKFIADYREQVFDQTWQDRALSQFLITEIKNQSEYLRNHGFVQLINHLQVDRMHWQQGKLMVTKPFDDHIKLNDDEVILLVPSYFVWPHLFVDHFSSGVTITYDALNKVKTRVKVNELSSVFNALSDPVRLKMMAYLADEPRTTQSLAQIMMMSDSTVSHHLKLLRDTHLINGEKQRKFVLYSPTGLAEEMIPNFYAYLTAGEEQGEI
ncbi:ArsR/SmtB family transcription factor [Lentilactobacillus kisonensis]|uniref:Transcriptional regulator, ArsR family n=2 Tax=Lentilactobacillus kisonensis TaxID=481722 RepID=H1LIG8_9LACO|nr:DUF5937 family protein [Lentilactobacillus kisonensis]EHO49758.1 transcriptional regulator, ArsR family [Lentilactobacillus kisonensis F0435]KRL22394.1 transcriptional regulator, ArsR family [Lentilactobacillus kisonensis DSM 19906 = JCM 15041]